MARHVYRGRVSIGYLAALVAASNAGGAGSVIGDTTTTMMWISGISPAAVFHAYAAAVVALVVCGIPAALQQHKYSPILKDELETMLSTHTSMFLQHFQSKMNLLKTDMQTPYNIQLSAGVGHQLAVLGVDAVEQEVEERLARGDQFLQLLAFGLVPAFGDQAFDLGIDDPGRVIRHVLAARDRVAEEDLFLVLAVGHHAQLLGEAPAGDHGAGELGRLLDVRSGTGGDFLGAKNLFLGHTPTHQDGEPAARNERAGAVGDPTWARRFRARS